MVDDAEEDIVRIEPLPVATEESEEEALARAMAEERDAQEIDA